MPRLRCLPLAFMSLALAWQAGRAQRPLYDEQANAHQQIVRAIAEAARGAKNVVLIFGANW